jgi:hypothetical protein
MQVVVMGIHSPVAQQTGSNYVLPCDFTFLGCDAQFSARDVDDWILHSLSHFDGQDPPRHATCPFCAEEDTRFDFEGDVFVNWRNRMLHIDEHFSQDPTHDFHQVKPDRLLLSYLVGLGVKVRSNSATTFDRFSSRPILHRYGAPGYFPAGDEGQIQYNNCYEESNRSSLLDHFEKSKDLPSKNLRMSYWNDAVPLNRNASRMKRKEERILAALDDLEKERREIRRESKKRKGRSSSLPWQSTSDGRHQANLSKVSHYSIQTTPALPNLLENVKHPRTY